ncbi:TerC family protein [Paracoccus sphaerophysae]|uniref:TerC family protein n=1 Tax=Paracoccus sphaerophysae TaxID=690417 RepID=UPI002358B5BA|nr:TerC family protein [Paracoccus sphaerophysae]
MEIFTAAGFSALLQVIAIDLVLAGDNAIVIGLAAAGLPRELRNRAILVGIIAATVMRIGFALITTQLLAIKGLLLVGGVLLLWVCWKMYTELRAGHAHDDAMDDVVAGDSAADSGAPRKTFAQAAMQIVIADVSMSLDNVLAVAGAAHGHFQVLIIGLVLSIALMGLASTWIARVINKYPWIAWGGLLVILYVSIKMIYEGAHQLGWI